MLTALSILINFVLIAILLVQNSENNEFNTRNVYWSGKYKQLLAKHKDLIAKYNKLAVKYNARWARKKKETRNG